MTIDTNQFWNALTESQLIGVPQIQLLFSQYSEDASIEKSPDSLASFLVRQKAISPYQSQILSAGHNGPFQYGNYTVFDRLASGPLAGQFLARHRKTGFPVLLQFFGGSQPSDLETWNQIESFVEPAIDIQHPNLAELFETVVLPNHRFVVSQAPGGSTLQEKLPPKSRLPWKKACAVAAQATLALDQLHQRKIVHNAVSPRSIWLEKNGVAQLRLNPISDVEFDHPASNEVGLECRLDYLAPEQLESGIEMDPDLHPAGDLYSLGCVLFRMIVGRCPFPETNLEIKKTQIRTKPPAELGKYKLPGELESLIKQLLAKGPNERPQSTSEVANLLSLISGKANDIAGLSIPASKTRIAYRKSLTQFLPGVEAPNETHVPEIATAPEIVESSEETEKRQATIKAAAEAIEKRKRSQWKVPASVAAGLLALSAMMAVFVYKADNLFVKQTEKPLPEIVDDDNPQPLQKDPIADLAAIPPALRPILFQTLIDDDEKSLWESPTNGPPIQLSHLPAAPKILLILRLAAFTNTQEGQRIVKGLGPEFARSIQQFQIGCGLDFENIERLVVSLHTNEKFEYEPYFIVTTTKPIEKSRLMQNWNLPVRRKLENQQVIFETANAPTGERGALAYYILVDESNEDGNPPTSGGLAENDDGPRPGNVEDREPATNASTNEMKIKRFAFGSRPLIEEVALRMGATALTGPMENLVASTDRDRHANLLFLRNSLFNDEGQKLMGPANLRLNRELSIMIPDQVRGGLFSFHLDTDCYLEMVLDKNVEIKAAELMSQMENELRRRRDQLMLYVAKIPSSDYWDIVRIRYGGMLANLFQNLRWNVEHGQVMANCWLPPMAAHNLIAATEHVIAFSGGTSTKQPVDDVPKSLAELLAIKRDLNVANPPDLNVLMSDLVTEITDDFGSLPFAFNIRLIGGDLEKEGITKNQRPSELVIQQKSLAEILTSIMVAANPAKDITGPADPNCKLVWVIADDPNRPGEQAILITTRAAAVEKSYQLPSAFDAK